MLKKIFRRVRKGIRDIGSFTKDNPLVALGGLGLGFGAGQAATFSGHKHQATPEVGAIYVFPSWLSHGVYPFRAKDPNGIRRSMSFNFTCVIHEELEGPNFQVTGSDVK